MTAPAEPAPAEEQPTEQPQEGDGEQQTNASTEETFSREYVEKLRRENAEHRTKAKDAEKARLASLTDAERSVAEAEARGRTEATTSFGKRLARTEFDALAARRNPDVDTASVLEYVDLARFVGDDGEPDSKAITAAVNRLIPEAQGLTNPSFDGGTRQSPPAAKSMTQLLREAAGRS